MNQILMRQPNENDKQNSPNYQNNMYTRRDENNQKYENINQNFGNTNKRFENRNQSFESTNKRFENQRQNFESQKRKKEIQKRNSNYNVYSVNGEANYQKSDIRKVIMIFSVILIVMGCALVGKSVYAFSVSKNKLKDTPEVSTDKMGKEVTITINTQYPIKEFSYRWNSGEETKIEGNQTVSISKTIDIPNGNNVLKISVIDCYGNKTEYMKQYIYESTDTEKPTIEIAKVGNKLKITATDETKIAYMTYSWNDEEPERVDAKEDQDKEIVTEIDVPKGESKLYLTAVDGEDNKQTRSEKIIAASKPTFTISTDQSNIIVNAKDEIGLKKIVVYVDNNAYDSGENPINQTEIQAKIPVSAGNHNITIIVTNTSDIEAKKELSVSI